MKQSSKAWQDDVVIEQKDFQQVEIDSLGLSTGVESQKALKEYQVYVTNDTGEEWPAHAVGVVKDPNGHGIAYIEKPTEDNIAAARLVINDHEPLPDGEHKIATSTLAGNLPALHDSSDVGDELGTEEDSWQLKKGNSGFISSGTVDDLYGAEVAVVGPFRSSTGAGLPYRTIPELSSQIINLDRTGTDWNDNGILYPSPWYAFDSPITTDGTTACAFLHSSFLRFTVDMEEGDQAVDVYAYCYIQFKNDDSGTESINKELMKIRSASQADSYTVGDDSPLYDCPDCYAELTQILGHEFSDQPKMLELTSLSGTWTHFRALMKIDYMPESTTNYSLEADVRLFENRSIYPHTEGFAMYFLGSFGDVTTGVS